MKNLILFIWKLMQKKNWLQRKLLFVCCYVLLIGFATSIQAQNLKNINDYSQFIAEQKAKERVITSSYANEINQLAATAQKNAQAPDIQAYIHQLQARNVLLDPTSPLQSTSSTGQILIFVSASMPQISLNQWFNQAQKIHAAFVVRGFINNSLPYTKNWVKGLMQQNNKKGGIQINPVAFERYGIQQVPAIVATRKTIQCPLRESCITPPFDVVYGNVSLSGALSVLANQGNVANEVAQHALDQMRTASE